MGRRVAVYDAVVVVVSISRALVFMLRTASKYDVAPLENSQVSVTLVVLSTVPGLLGEPGDGFAGVTGIVTGALGVAVAKLLGGPCPTAFTALTM